MEKRRIALRPLLVSLVVVLALSGLFTGCGGGGSGATSDPNVTAGSENYEVRDFAPAGGSHRATADTYQVVGAITYSPSGEASSSNIRLHAGPLAAE